jgi:hypothetical protein
VLQGPPIEIVGVALIIEFVTTIIIFVTVVAIT